MKILDRIRIARERALENSHLNPFALDLFDEATAIAPTLDPSLPLYGLLCTIKDIFQVGDHPTMGGTRAPLPPLYAEGPAVAALRAAGALCVAKTNTHEVALGLTGENQWTGDVKNPLDPTRQSGGSSSGSAVSVAISACDFSIGSDTAGSIRVPASYCGAIGYKPTYGLVSLAGALPLVPSCDHVGVIARELDVLSAVLKVWGVPVGSPQGARKPVYAIPRTYLNGRLSRSVERCFGEFCARHIPDAIDLPLPDPQPCITNYTKLRRESFLFHRDAIEHHPEGFSPRVLELLQSGNVSEREYLEAKSWQNAYTLEIDTLLTRCDVLVLPTTPTAAPTRATTHIELISGEVSLRDALVPLTLPFSMAGVPTISLPLLSAEGLPVGLQLVARRGHDSTLIRCSTQLLKEAL